VIVALKMHVISFKVMSSTGLPGSPPYIVFNASSLSLIGVTYNRPVTV